MTGPGYLQRCSVRGQEATCTNCNTRSSRNTKKHCLFTVWVTEHCEWLPKEVGGSLSLETPKRFLVTDLGNLI